MEAKEKLKLKLSVIMVKYGLTFIHLVSDFQSKLLIHFKEHYTDFEIGNALRELEEQFLDAPETIMEIPEDFELNEVTR